MMIEYTAAEKKIQKSANIAYKDTVPGNLAKAFPNVTQVPSNGFLVISKSDQCA